MNCKQCDKPFTRYGIKVPKFCSVRCRAESKKKIREPKPRRVNELPIRPKCARVGCDNRAAFTNSILRKYCGHECATLDRIVPTEQRICQNANCGKPYTRKKGCESRQQWEKRRFCSPVCAGSNYKQNQLGDSKDFFAMSQQEIADRLGISVRRVQQHEESAKKKMLNAIMASPTLRELFLP